MKGYKIYTAYDGAGRDLARQCNIAFQSVGGACGCSFHKDGKSEFYIWGKFSDMVRVYSALKNNGYLVKTETHEEYK